jgi:hypothetical protein
MTKTYCKACGQDDKVPNLDGFRCPLCKQVLFEGIVTLRGRYKAWWYKRAARGRARSRDRKEAKRLAHRRSNRRVAA